MKDDLASMTPEQREEYEYNLKETERLEKEREQYVANDGDGLTNDLIRLNTEEIKGISDYIFNVHHPLKYGFAHRRKSFNSIMLGVIALTLIYIAIKI